MSAGWVAASTRGRALLGRLVGVAGARAIATADSWDDAEAQLRTTLYGTDLAGDADRASARRTAAGATAWQLRVLAGWLPPGAVALARVFAAPLEIANVEARLDRLRGDPPAPAIPLGSLAVTGGRIESAASLEQVRRLLARSAWGDPGGDDRVTLGLGLRLAWARRIIRQVPGAREWALGAAAVMLAREMFTFGRTPSDHLGRMIDPLLGHHWRRAIDVADLARLVPPSATWAFGSDPTVADLWEAELRVVRRIADDAEHLVRSGRYDRDTVMAVMALLLVDLWRVTAAIEVAGRAPAEVFDAVA